MNIFVLDTDPVVAAQSMCDKHVVKMILESAQMLCSSHTPGMAPYRRAFYNHPCTRWSRATLANYNWLIDHALALSDEMLYRYDKIHASTRIIKWARDNVNRLKLPKGSITKFALAMPYDCKRECPVESYRLYYKNYKSHFATWKRRNPPKWW